MRVRTPNELGLRIRERRLESGLDQAALAAKVGVSRQWIVEIEKGKPRAEIGLVMRALNALGLEVWVGDPPAEDGPRPLVVDLDRVIARAKGERDER